MRAMDMKTTAAVRFNASSYIDRLKSYLTEFGGFLRHTLRWLIIAVSIGLAVGSVSVLFAWCDLIVNNFRAQHGNIIYALPLIGIIIAFLYNVTGHAHPGGTNIVISTLQAQGDIPFAMAPLIFVSTVLTHLAGGSVGREGAALQLGGSLGAALGRTPLYRKLAHGAHPFDEKLDEGNRRIIIMCAMSAAFSAIFGTPMAAAIFSMEVVSIGIMHYSALFPCFIASLSAYRFAYFLGFDKEKLSAIDVPAGFDIKTMAAVLVLSSLCGVLSAAFCLTLKHSGRLFATRFKSPYVRIVVGGTAVIILTLLIGSDDYLGAGMGVIERAVAGEVYWYDFIMKIIFTAICIGAGYKGGEIVPSFFIGATFGALFGKIVGISPSLCAACGMTAMFCGVTNCPITSMLIASELFDFRGVRYILMSVAVSYVMSGYYGLYSSQRIIYSKFHNRYVNRVAGERPTTKSECVARR